MIRAEYNPSESRLIVEGHAGYGEEGKDIICAAVSILTDTFISVCMSMDKAQWTTKPAKLDLDKGKAIVQAYPRTNTCYVARCKLDAIAEGFFTVAERYPDYFSFKLDRSGG